MARQSTEDVDTAGHDSFLDVVANLVGILLILIMVIGVRTRHAWKSVSSNGLLNTANVVANGASTVPESDVKNKEILQFAKLAEQQLLRLKESAFKLDDEARAIAEKVAERRSEQESLQLAVSAAEKGL